MILDLQIKRATGEISAKWIEQKEAHDVDIDIIDSDEKIPYWAFRFIIEADDANSGQANEAASPAPAQRTVPVDLHALQLLRAAITRAPGLSLFEGSGNQNASGVLSQACGHELTTSWHDAGASTRSSGQQHTSPSVQCEFNAKIHNTGDDDKSMRQPDDDFELMYANEPIHNSPLAREASAASFAAAEPTRNRSRESTRKQHGTSNRLSPAAPFTVDNTEGRPTGGADEGRHEQEEDDDFEWLYAEEPAPDHLRSPAPEPLVPHDDRLMERPARARESNISGPTSPSSRHSVGVFTDEQIVSSTA